LAEAVLSGFQIGEDGELIEDEDEQAAIRKAFAIFRPLYFNNR
jgi:hypothetical protein